MLSGKILIDHRKIKFIVFAFALSLHLFSCSKTPEKTEKKFSIKDDAGIDVEFSSYPERIISLGPNITETIYALGADTLLYGVTEFCDYPPEVKTKVNTGSYLSPDYEIISSLKPDLIIVNVESSNNPTYQSLKNMGYNLFLSHAKDIEGIFKMVNDIGKITNRENNANILFNSISDQLKYKDPSSVQKKDKTVLILIAINPMMTTNKNTFINEIALLAGLKNIYSEEDQEYPVINYEDVVSKNPSFIIFPADTLDTEKIEIYKKELTEKLSNSEAVKNGKVIFIDDDIMFRPGPRITDAVKTLRAHIKTD